MIRQFTASVDNQAPESHIVGFVKYYIYSKYCLLAFALEISLPAVMRFECVVYLVAMGFGDVYSCWLIEVR